MAVDKPTPAPRKRGRGADTAGTKAALMDAAFETLRDQGIAGVTARAVADRAHANQAAIYYHFGGIEQLLVAALERSSQLRLEAYQDALAEPMTLGQLIDQLEVLYERDRASGHLRVMTQMVAGAASSPELGEGIRNSIERWVDFVETKIGETLANLPFGQLLSPADLTQLVFSLVIGIETRDQIDPQPGLTDRLFALAKMGAYLVDQDASTR